MVTFTKFGSCVTSDVFNFMNISNYYPKTYIYWNKYCNCGT